MDLQILNEVDTIILIVRTTTIFFTMESGLSHTDT